MKKGKRLATVKEACAYAKMGHSKLYLKINAGTVVAYKDGKRTLIDLDSIDAGLEPWQPGRKPKASE
jgi:excisionase family DNA binding protein